MFELVRTAEGTISRAEFRRGAMLLIFVFAIVAAIFYGARLLSTGMAWMTVSVAPFLGVVLFFLACSLVYFWYCLLAKRLRGIGQSPYLLNALIAAIGIAAAARLLQYQNEMLDLASDGWIAQAGTLAMLAGFAASVFFIILLGIGWFGPDRVVGPGQCFPDIARERDGGE